MAQQSLPEWFYVRNPFDNSTKNNFKKMLSLSRDHHDKLYRARMDSLEVDALYQLFLPHHTKFVTAYMNVHKTANDYRASTRNFENMTITLSKKAKTWEAWILTQFDSDSNEYLTLLPHRKIPFQTGTYEIRLDVLATFEKALRDFPDLANVLSEVTAFRKEMEAARTKQQGFEQQDTHLRQELERCRFELAVAMHQVLGGLIQLYAHQPNRIESFYELRYLRISPTRTKDNVGEEHNISRYSRSKVVGISYNNDSTFFIQNTGATDLGFFATDDENSATPIDLTILKAGESQEYELTDLTDGANKPNLLIVVNNGDKLGRYKLAIG